MPNEIPNTIETRFASASAGKVFIAVGILQLIEQGKIEFDNPDGKDVAYFQGCDPGVSFLSEYNPNNGMISVLASNYGDNVWSRMRKIRQLFYPSP